MVKFVGSQQDFMKIPVLGIVPESSSTAPSSPATGQLWNDTTNNVLKRWNGSSWDTVSTGTISGTAGGDLTGTYPNPTLAAGAVSAADVNASLKLSGSAATTDEALRALGFTTGLAAPGTARLDQFAVPTADLSMNTHKITNVTDPTAAQDAATKNYVDLMRQGIQQKDAVALATTADVTLSGFQSVDGVATSVADRVLVKNQTTASENGIYVSSSGAWARAADADTFAELQDGTTVFVQRGATQLNTSWAQTATLTSLSGGAAQAWVQQGAASTVTGTTNRVTVSSGVIDIASTYVGQTSLTTLGTVTTGTWTGTSIAVANGGTGATTAATARANLSATGKFSGSVAALVAGTPTTVTHNLGTTEVQASFRLATGDDAIDFAWEPTSTNAIAVTADVAFSASAIKVVVVG